MRKTKRKRLLLTFDVSAFDSEEILEVYLRSEFVLELRSVLFQYSIESQSGIDLF